MTKFAFSDEALLSLERKTLELTERALEEAYCKPYDPSELLTLQKKELIEKKRKELLDLDGVISVKVVTEEDVKRMEEMENEEKTDEQV